MGTIDVSELLCDPDFVDDLTIVHRAATVNAKGENVLVEQVVLTIGTVQPASGKTLQRLPEALRVGDVRSFWVKGEVISDGTNQYPDVIDFQGSRYAVQTLMDWTNWGDGWTEGTCIREKPTL